jgi:hypothetical protein
MQQFHKFASAAPNSPNPNAIKTSNWNDIHQSGAVPTLYNASGVVPPAVDYIRATGTIALQLTSASAIFTGQSGSFTVNQVYYAKNVGAGVVTFSDSAGMLFEDGSATYALTQKGQWAIFIWNPPIGITPGFWEVLGGNFS